MKSLSVLLLVSIVAGCSHRPSKEQLATFDQKINNEKLQTVRDLGPSSETRIPLKAGQWVKFHTVIKDGDQSFATFKVLKVNGKNVTMEVETTNASTLGLTVMQYEVENFPTHNELDIDKKKLEGMVDKMVIKKIIMKHGNDAPQEIGSAYMPMAKGMLKQLFSSGYRIGDISKVPCASSTLKASRCMVFDYEASAYGFTTKGTSYAHSAVPIVGFIKSVSDKSETQIVNFGLTGAKSSL